MAAFEWRSEYSVGNDSIDQQHQGIIDILNELHGLLNANGEATGEAGHVFDRLAQYVTTHFAYEEQLMIDMGYPTEEFAAHRQQHNLLLRQVQKIMQAYEAGDQNALQELLPFLYGDWLIDHICQSDHEYKPFLK